MQKQTLFFAVFALSACGMSDPMLGTWKGDTDPSGTAKSFTLTLSADKDHNYTYTQNIVTVNAADAEALAGCTVEHNYVGSFSDNPYDSGGVLSLPRGEKSTVKISGCAADADNAAEAPDTELAAARYLYRIKGNVLEMNEYGSDKDAKFYQFTRG